MKLGKIMLRMEVRKYYCTPQLSIDIGSLCWGGDTIDSGR